MPHQNAPAELFLNNPFFWVIAAFLIFYVVSVAIRMREGIGYILRVLLIAFVSYWIARAVLPAFHAEPQWIPFLSLAAAFIVLFMIPQRSRYVRKGVRRKVIERHIRRGGTFDPKEHEIDHVVAFSIFGGNTAENLRVLPRKANRRKGKKMPKLTDLL